jgi:hypothetical protein
VEKTDANIRLSFHSKAFVQEAMRQNYDFLMHGATIECLQQSAFTLSSCQDMEVEDRGDFCLNLEILSSQTVAAAA